MDDEKPDLKDGRILLVEDDFVNGKIQQAFMPELLPLK